MAEEFPGVTYDRVRGVPNPLESRVRADHPEAVDKVCLIPTRPRHTAHPYGRTMPGGGLAFWCPGRQP